MLQCKGFVRRFVCSSVRSIRSYLCYSNSNISAIAAWLGIKVINVSLIKLLVFLYCNLYSCTGGWTCVQGGGYLREGYLSVPCELTKSASW